MGGAGIMRCGWSLGSTVGSGGGRSGKVGWIHPTGHPESQAERLGLYSAGKREPIECLGEEEGRYLC